MSMRSSQLSRQTEDVPKFIFPPVTGIETVFPIREVLVCELSRRIHRR
jgi:hypothetical protein